MTLWLLFLKKDVIYLPDNYDINILAKMSIVCRKDDCEFSVNITNDDDTDPRHPGLGQAGPPRDCRNVEIHQPTNQPITTDSPGKITSTRTFDPSVADSSGSTGNYAPPHQMINNRAHAKERNNEELGWDCTIHEGH